MTTSVGITLGASAVPPLIEPILITARSTAGFGREKSTWGIEFYIEPKTVYFSE